MNPLAFLQWHENALKERSPAPTELTDTERLDWFSEYCDKYGYVWQTEANIGYHEIICCDERTISASFRDAIDEAAAKWKEVNGE